MEHGCHLNYFTDGKRTIHLRHFTVHFRRFLSVHFRHFTIHFGRLSIHLRRLLSVHLRHLPVHFRRLLPVHFRLLAVHFRRFLSVHLRHLPVHFRRFDNAQLDGAVHVRGKGIVSLSHFTAETVLESLILSRHSVICLTAKLLRRSVIHLSRLSAVLLSAPLSGEAVILLCVRIVPETRCRTLRLCRRCCIGCEYAICRKRPSR